jgi:hypothetical protein
VVLSQGLDPKRYALGAAAALIRLAPDEPIDAPPGKLLDPIWQGTKTDTSERERVLASIAHARSRLASWQSAGYPNPDAFFKD